MTISGVTLENISNRWVEVAKQAIRAYEDRTTVMRNK